MRPLLPGATVGVVGGGQLGRMLAFAARRLGYRVAVLDPNGAGPAAQLADLVFAAPYDDESALRDFGAAVDAVTVEFENVPAASLRALEALVPVRPGPQVLHLTQDRLREKRFLERHGFPQTRFEPVATEAELEAARARLGPALLKTAAFGYDGKGQVRLEGAETGAARRLLDTGPCVCERVVDFVREVSVVVARGADGRTVDSGAIENRHAGGILDLSCAPSSSSSTTRRRAAAMARDIAATLDAVGTLAVEFFELEDGSLLVNEIAPRPHNSGHLTIEASPASQFEQQLRALCGLPLGELAPRGPAAMANLLGDLWSAGEPDWAAALAVPGVTLHLYGKREARPGRKMGHLTALAADPGAALELVRRARRAAAGEPGRRGP